MKNSPQAKYSSPLRNLTTLDALYDFRLENIKSTIQNVYMKLLKDEVFLKFKNEKASLEHINERVKEIFREVFSDEREEFLEDLIKNFSGLKNQLMQSGEERKKVASLYEKMQVDLKERVASLESQLEMEKIKNNKLVLELESSKFKCEKTQDDMVNVLQDRKDEFRSYVVENEILKEKIEAIHKNFESYKKETERNLKHMEENIIEKEKNLKEMEMKLTRSKSEFQSGEKETKISEQIFKTEGSKLNYAEKLGRSMSFKKELFGSCKDDDQMNKTIKKYKKKILNLKEKLIDHEKIVKDLQNKIVEIMESSENFIEDLKKNHIEEHFQQQKRMDEKFKQLENKYIEKLEFLESQSVSKIQEISKKKSDLIEKNRFENEMERKKILEQKSVMEKELSTIEEKYQKKIKEMQIELNQNADHRIQELLRSKQHVEKNYEILLEEFRILDKKESERNKQNIEEKISKLVASAESWEKKCILAEQKIVNQDIKINDLEQNVAQSQMQIQTMLRGQKISEEKIQLKNMEEDGLNKKIKNFEDQISKAKNQIIELEEKASDKEKEYHKLLQEGIKLKAELSKKDQQISSMNIELNSLQKNFESEVALKSRINSLEMETIQLRNQITDCQTRNKNNQRENLDKLQNTILDLENRLKLQNISYIDLKRNLEEFKSENKSLRMNLAEKTDRSNKQQSQLNDLKTAFGRISLNSNKKKKEISQKLQKFSNNLSQIKPYFDTSMNNFLLFMSNRINILSNMFNKKLQLKDNLIESLKKNVTEETSQKKQLMDQLMEERERLSELSVGYEQLHNAFESERKTNQQKLTDSETVKKYSNQIQKLQQQITSLESDKRILEFNRVQFESEHKNILNEKNSLTQEIFNLKLQLAQTSPKEQNEKEIIRSSDLGENAHEQLEILRSELGTLYKRHKNTFNEIESQVENLRNQQNHEIESLEQSYKEIINVLKEKLESEGKGNIDKKCKELEEQRENMKGFYEKEIERLEDECNKIIFQKTLEYDKVKWALIAKNKELEKANNDIKEHEIWLNEKNAMINSLKAENSNLQSQIKTIQFQLDLRINQLNPKLVNISEEVAKYKDDPQEIPLSGRSNSSYIKTRQKSALIGEKSDRCSNYDRNSDIINKRINDLRHKSESISTNPMLTYKEIPIPQEYEKMGSSRTHLPGSQTFHKYSKSSSNFLQYSNKLALRLTNNLEPKSQRKSPERRGAQKSSLI